MARRWGKGSLTCTKIGYRSEEQAKSELKMVQARRSAAGDEKVEQRVYRHTNGPLPCWKWHLTSQPAPEVLEVPNGEQDS